MNRKEAMKIIESNRVYYRDFKHEEFNEALERLKQPLTLAELLGWEVGAEYEDDEGQAYLLTEPNDLQIYHEATQRWVYFYLEWSDYTIDGLRSAKRVEDKKKYQIPLPNLITTDGKQQYLTEKEGHWFACRLTEGFKQEWTEDEFHSIPSAYIGYAKEMGGDERNDWHNVEVWRWIDE